MTVVTAPARQRFDAPRGHVARQLTPVGAVREVGHPDRQRRVRRLPEFQAGRDGLPRLVLHLQVPRALRRLPAVPHRALGQAQLAGRFVQDEALPARVVHALRGGELAGAQQRPRPMAAVRLLLERDQERGVGELLLAENPHSA
jgi:hypothetical protein